MGGILTIIKIIGSLLSFFLDRNKEKKKKKKEALKEILDGIDEEDPSRITAGFDRIKRMR